MYVYIYIYICTFFFSYIYIYIYTAAHRHDSTIAPGGAVAGRASPLSVGHLLRAEHCGVAHLHAARVVVWYSGWEKVGFIVIYMI